MIYAEQMSQILIVALVLGAIKGFYDQFRRK